MSVCPSLCLSVFLSVRLSILSSASLFGDNKSADRNCVQHMQPQATGSSTLSGSIICPSVCPSVRLSSHPQAFSDFGISINFQCGGPASICIYPGYENYPHTGVRRNPVGSSQAYMFVPLSLCLSLCPVVRVDFC